MMFGPFIKQMPILGLTGYSGGATSLFRKAGGPFEATGGNVNGLEPGNGYKYHTFTSPGNFVVTGQGADVQYLVIGGGGGGGKTTAAGGGGAGGLRTGTVTCPVGTHTVTVGEGGHGGGGSNDPDNGAPGGISTFGSLIGVIMKVVLVDLVVVEVIRLLMVMEIR